MSTEPVIESARGQLEAERASLAEQLDALGTTAPAANLDSNFADSAQVAAEVGEARTLAESLREQLDAVEAALERIAAGTYGICQSCGGPVGDARLEAMPETRYCINCASGRK